MTAQKAGQQTGGGDAVHIIVAEDGDFFTPGHGKANPAGGQVHILHQERIVQGRIAAQIGLGLFGIHDTPGGEHHGSQGSIPALDQSIHCTHLRLGGLPDTIFHKQYTSIITFSLYYSKKPTDVQ